MSENDGTAGVIREVASRVWGNGQSKEGDYLRPTEAEGQVERSTHAQAATQNNQLQTDAHTETAETVASSWGSNATLPMAEVERALLCRLQEMAKTSGKHDVPADIVDFISKANVIFLDNRNQRVSFSRVVVAWEG